MSNLREESEKQYLRSLDKYLNPPLRLEGVGYGAAEGWFLGPKAENEELLMELIVDAIREHCRYRRNFHPEDPDGISEEEKQSDEYKYAVRTLKGYAGQLCEKLQLSAPFFSMRYQSHMLWDQALPAIIGYFAAMLYNQNNVAAEASPITTLLEIEVGNDLCRMLGYVPKNGIEPWGHITCGGSVANIEALWAARNAKFFPVAVSAALQEKKTPLLPAKDLKVRRLNGKLERLRDLDVWALLNLKLDEVVSLPYRIAERCGKPVDELAKAINKHTVQNIGMAEFYRLFLSKEGIEPPVVFVPSTRHYSWPKGATLLGLGQNSIVPVPVNTEARMDIAQLRLQLDDCRDRRVPVIAVVAVIGSTGESAVDPLAKILSLRTRYRTKGEELHFSVHCDAAWGGYFASMLRKDEKVGRSNGKTKPDRFSPAEGEPPPGRHCQSFHADLCCVREVIPDFPMNDHVRKQYECLGQADSITVDPHKAGYVPYPAGALCYRNSAMRDLISLKAPVIFHSGKSEPTVGIYGIEGSKPGAAAAAVWLSHRVIRPTQGGYGRILGQCMWTCTRLYCRLVTMTDRHFKIVLLNKLPSERKGLGKRAIQEEKRYIRKHFVHRSNAELLAFLKKNKKARKLFKELGSDQLILAYSFNYYTKPGDPDSLNTDAAKMNELNNEVFQICSITAPVADLNSKKLILTNSAFSAQDYSQKFVDEYCGRAGVKPTDREIIFLISTTMDPWTTDIPKTPDTPEGDFLAVVEDALREAVYRALSKVFPKAAQPQ